MAQLKIWDAGSGACVATLEGHGGIVCSVAFSHDGTWLALTLGDGTVKFWGAGSGVCLQTLNIDKSLSRIFSDTTGSFLHTEIGTSAIYAPAVPNVEQDAIERPIPQCKVPV